MKDEIKTKLLEAARTGNIEELESCLANLIDKGELLLADEEEVKSGLIEAAVDNNQTSTLLNLANKFAPRTNALRNEFLNNALNRSAEKGKLDLIKTLIKAGANIYSMADEAKANKDVSPIVELVDALHHKVINSYLTAEPKVTLHELQKEEYFNIDAPLNNEGDTALHMAVRLNQEDKVKELLKNGASLEVTNHYNLTPLALASSKNIAELLVKKGANVYADGILSNNNAEVNQFINEIQLLHVEVGNYSTGVVKSFTLEHLKSKPYFDVNAALDNRGNSSLFLAASYGLEDRVKALLDIGANPNAMDYDGARVLLAAITSGNASIVELLLARGADPYKTWGDAVPALRIIDRYISEIEKSKEDAYKENQEILGEEQIRLDNLRKIRGVLVKEQSKETSIGWAWTGAAAGLATGIVSWFMFDLTTIAGVSLVNPYVPAAVIVIAAAVAIGSLIGAATGWATEVTQRSELPKAPGLQA